MKATSSTKFKTVDEYLSTLPENVKGILEKLRQTIKETAPQAEELISYNMPAFKYYGMLVFYAAAKAHIGFYPTPIVIEVFKEELAAYKTSKGAIQFPIDQALPFELIKKMVEYKASENLEKYRLKEKKKK